MKKKIIGIMVCMMMLAMIPIASGANFCSDAGETGPLDKTFIRGIVLFPRPSVNGKNLVFFAFRLHYRTTNMFDPEVGVLRLQRVTIPRDLQGYVGKFYIFGSFKGSLEE